MGESYKANYPDDLNKNNQVKTGEDYFTVVVPDLKIGTPYSFQFKWVFLNGTSSKWSNGYSLTTASYTSKLTKPTITVTPASLGYTVSYTKQTDKNFDNAIIEDEAIVAAGSVVKPGMIVPSGMMVAGIPATIIREVRPDEKKGFIESAEHYREISESYREEYGQS